MILNVSSDKHFKNYLTNDIFKSTKPMKEENDEKVQKNDSKNLYDIFIIRKPQFLSSSILLFLNLVEILGFWWEPK